MMDAERQLLDAVEELAGDSSRSDLKKAFEQYRTKTEGHIAFPVNCRSRPRKSASVP